MAKYDAFICHASEDKKDVARPLAETLKKRGFQVWYDEFELKVGMSLSQSIDRGLSESRFGIVILSQNFFAKNWPARELRGLVAMETSGKGIILPVWHGVRHDDILKFSPPLVDVYSVSTDNGLDIVIEEITKTMLGDSVLAAKYTEHNDSGTPGTKIQSDYQIFTPLIRIASIVDGENNNELSEIVEAIAKHLKWPETKIKDLKIAAYLRNIGKVGISTSILNKPGKFNIDEFNQLKSHTKRGVEILSQTGHECLEMASTIAEYHHERWDGTGYPNGISGYEIPIEARLVTIVDIYCVLTHQRRYKEAFTIEKSLEIMEHDKGKIYDPELFESFKTVIYEIKKNLNEI